MQKITPFIWFDDQAEEAANYYVSVFKNSKIGKIARYNDEAAAVAGKPKGSVMTVEFELEGHNFVALNGGPYYKLTPAISFAVDCRTQEEIDKLWQQLSDGGEIQQCGWLTDKFGVSWQIVPTGLEDMLNDKNPDKARRTMHAMLQMKKLDIAQLKAAYDGYVA
jgi:predicted 3-demethylubiquinone-9 3-methyltransferase (glyoxalase superfamily)